MKSILDYISLKIFELKLRMAYNIVLLILLLFPITIIDVYLIPLSKLRYLRLRKKELINR